MAKNDILVSIIIVNFNGKDVTKQLLDSLKKLDFPKQKYEIILVDNDSKDGSQELIKKNYPYVKLIENKENSGWCEGVNIGFRIAKGKYFAPLNNDIIVDKNWLKELVKAIESNPDAGAVGPIVLNKYEKKYYNEIDYCSGTTTLMQFPIEKTHLIKNTRKPVNTWTVSGVYLARSDIVKEFPSAVPYDKDYFAYAEDNYFCWMMRIKGYELYTVPTSKLLHEAEYTKRTFTGMSNRFAFYSERNKWLNMLCFYSAGNLIRLIPLFIISFIFFNFYMIFLDFKKTPARMKAYWYLLSNLGKTLKKRKIIQQQRKKNDKALIARMSGKLVDEGSIFVIIRPFIWVLNRISLLYCWLTGIRTIEFRKNG